VLIRTAARVQAKIDEGVAAVNTLPQKTQKAQKV
jgi:hypothetical protein